MCQRSLVQFSRYTLLLIHKSGLLGHTVVFLQSVPNSIAIRKSLKKIWHNIKVCLLCIYRVVGFSTPSYLSHLMRNLNLEFLIFSFVSGLTGGTLIWLIIGTLRMVLRHFLLLYPPPLRMPPLWHCHCHGHRPDLSRRGLMIYLDWHSYFFDFSITYHLNWEKDTE